MPSSITNPISLYPKPWNIESQDAIPLDLFLENIRDGKWQDIVLPIRLLEGEAYDKEKKKAPSVTISGKFTKREDNAIEKHSGYIGIDVDDVKDPEELKSLLCPDKYIVSAFVSIGGKGLCLLFNIETSKHREAFQGISEYLFNSYNIIVDPTSVNPSRARFVSYDPDIYIAAEYEKFKLYPKEKPPKRIDKAVFSQDDFEQILKQIVERQLNITADSYSVWLRLGFAIAWKFGEGGRQAFHIVSQYSAKYDTYTCDKQYTACLKHHPSTKQEATISTFYWYAKQAGCNLYSERTKIIAYTTLSSKKAGLSEEQIIKNLEEFEGITNAQDIVEQVYRNDIYLDEDSQIDQIKLWLKQNYSISKNLITRQFVIEGKVLSKREMNSIWVRARGIFEKLPIQDLKNIITSDLFPEYNPLHTYFNELQDNSQRLPINLGEGEHLEIPEFINLLRTHAPLCTKLFSSITCKDPDYLLYFGTKWLVGIISAAYGEHSSLVLVLSGELVNIGKTQWFRRLLPKELHDSKRIYPDYYAESKLDAGKDDYILMTQKLIVMDDEFGGKSKKDAKLFKDVTSKETFSLREPYGETNVDLKRLAVLCGTCNEQDLITDTIKNRRLIPIHVTHVDHKTYNSVNKRELFTEVLNLYLAGMRWEIKGSDINYLNQDQHFFETVSLEEELILKYFKPGESYMTASEIKTYIEQRTNQKLMLDRIGKTLRKLGFEKKAVRVDANPKWVWLVAEELATDFGRAPQNFRPPKQDKDDLPF